MEKMTNFQKDCIEIFIGQLARDLRGAWGENTGTDERIDFIIRLAKMIGNKEIVESFTEEFRWKVKEDGRYLRDGWNAVYLKRFKNKREFDEMISDSVLRTLYEEVDELCWCDHAIYE